MPAKNLHDHPFDEGTIIKLEIFESYAKAWIPTFVMQRNIKKICVFDFFAGNGKDKNGVYGSSIRLLEQLKVHIGHLFQQNVHVEVYLNEFDSGKLDQLKENCQEYLSSNSKLKKHVTIHYAGKDFDEIFDEWYSLIKNWPSLVYLDQNGIKFLGEKYLHKLEATRRTDFLYFISSSYFWRFGNSEEFQSNLNIDMEEAKKDSYVHIHRNICKQLRKKLPSNTSLRLYPFSIKKKQNIHGIIFGSSHPAGVNKFLNIVWTQNSINGEANFDLDEDIKKAQWTLFGKRPTKIEKFQKNVQDAILSGKILNNKQALEFSNAEGHIGRHASDTIKALKNENRVYYDRKSPCVTYNAVYQKKIIVQYKVIKNEAVKN